MERVSFILIDQVRANMKIESRFQQASNERGVGDFGNYKSATAVSALQHNLRQWLFISKGVKLKPADPMGVDGWLMHVYTEKNKLAPSQFYIPLVFDKKWGVIPFFSEYVFLSEKTKTENRYWPNPKKLIYPFSIVTSANSKILKVVDPHTDAILYESSKTMERKMLERYNGDQEFHYWFDKAVDISIEQRIKKALFRDVADVISISQTNVDSDPDDDQETVGETFAAAFETVQSEPQIQSDNNSEVYSESTFDPDSNDQQLNESSDNQNSESTEVNPFLIEDEE